MGTEGASPGPCGAAGGAATAGWPGTAACNGGGANKGCQIAQSYGGATTLSLANLAAGTYYVWVDGAGLSSGKFTIRWQ